jgi:hypothetical protein
MTKHHVATAGVMLVVISLSAGRAVASSATGGQAATRSTAVAWMTDLSSGDARAACDLQDVLEVDGVPCEQLPVQRGPAYCAEIPPRPTLTPSQQVRRVWGSGGRGSAIVAQANRPIRVRATLRLERIQGRWRVTALEYGSTRSAPAGLADVGPDLNLIGRFLWPVC